MQVTKNAHRKPRMTLHILRSLLAKPLRLVAAHACNEVHAVSRQPGAHGVVQVEIPVPVYYLKSQRKVTSNLAVVCFWRWDISKCYISILDKFEVVLLQIVLSRNDPLNLLMWRCLKRCTTSAYHVLRFRRVIVRRKERWSSVDHFVADHPDGPPIAKLRMA